MALGTIVFIFGVITMLFLVEYPSKIGISIKEEGKMLDPSRISIKKFARTQEDNENIPEIKFSEAFQIFGLLQFAFSFFFIKFAFYGVYYWIPTYLQ